MESGKLKVESGICSAYAAGLALRRVLGTTYAVGVAFVMKVKGLYCYGALGSDIKKGGCLK